MRNLGIVLTLQEPAAGPAGSPEAYADALRIAEAAEDLGLDQVWLSEHHFTDDGYCPSVLPLAAAIAARTSRIRIGTKVLLLPLHDPLRLAEDIAVVDQISGGRLEIGVAAGYRRVEFDGFGLPYSGRGARLDEALEILTRVLRGESAESAGRFYRYGAARISPQPVQNPVPLWLGGRSKASMRRVARLGADLALGDFDPASCAEDLANFHQVAADDGHDIRHTSVCVIANVVVDRDPRRAHMIAGEPIRYQQQTYARWFAETADRPMVTAADVDGSAAGSGFVGTPADVAEQIGEFHDRVPFTHFSFFPQLPGMSARDALQSLELFARDVAPRLRARDHVNAAEPVTGT